MSSAVVTKCPNLRIACGFDYKMSVESHSTDSMLGATHEAKDLEFLNSKASRSSTRLWREVLGRNVKIPGVEEVTSYALEQGHPVALEW